MGRPERPLDPHAGPIERLAWELRALRNEAGRPSYRELARRAHFSRSTLAEAATGMRLPTLEATLAYAVTCGGDHADWETRWQAAADELERSRRRCPYPGLTPLRAEDADLFFGRDQLVEDLRKAVARAPLTAVFGASGSGKSSLLLAGLLPGLASEGTSTAVMTPGARPRAELDAAVAELPEDGVLVIDQFEEVFTLCTDDTERSAFLDAVAELASAGDRPTLVLGVRGDFYGHCSRHPGLVAALRDNVQLPIGPVSVDELRAIVAEPAARVGLTAEPALVEAVLAEAAGEPGTLPLVAHALRETWRRQPGEVLRLADYRAAGGVREAVAQTAERLYADLDAPHRRLVRALFLRLTALGDGTEDTRRRLGRDELAGVADPGEIDEVLDRLAAARLVVVDRDTVEPAHEALIDAWPRLREWLADDRAALHRHRRLTSAAAEWDGHDRRPEFLFRGVRLAEWAEAGPAPLNELERAFLAAGRTHEDAERAVARRRIRRTFGGLSITAVVVAALAVLALIQADRNADARDRALSRQLAAEARRQLTVDPTLALLLATEAYKVEPTAEADVMLRQAVTDSRLRRTLAAGPTIAEGLVASPDRSRFVLWGKGRSVGTELRLWRWAGTSPVQDGPDFGTAQLVSKAAFSADGRTLALGLNKGAIEIWDLTGSPKRTRTLQTTGTLGDTPVAFSAKGKLAAVHGKELYVWDMNRPSKPDVLRVPESPEAVAFSADGNRLAISGSSMPLLLLDVTGPRLKESRRAQSGLASELAFSSDGSWVASTDPGAVRLWRDQGWPERDEWLPEAALRAHEGYPRGAAFSRDGSRLVTFADDRTIRVWDTGNSLDPLVLRVPAENSRGAAFSPDGKALVDVARNGTLRVWDVTTGPAETSPTFQDHTRLSDQSISGDGRLVAAASALGNRIAVWDTARGGPPVHRFQPPRGQAEVVALSPDGRRLAATGLGPVRVWDLTRGGGPAEIAGLENRGSKLVFSPDGRMLAVGEFGGTGIRTWRLPDHGPPSEVTGWLGKEQGHKLDGALAFSPDGRRLAAARDPKGVKEVWVWNLSGQGRPTVLRGHRGMLGSLVFSPDGRSLAGSAADGAVLRWDLATGAATVVLRGSGQEILQHQDLAFTPDGRWLAAAASAGGLRLWRSGGAPDPLVVSGVGQVGPFTVRGGRIIAPLTGAVGRDGALRWLGPARARIWECEVCGSGERVLDLARQRATRALTSDERRLYLNR